MFYLFLVIIQVSLAVEPIEDKGDDIMQFFESMYPAPTAESRFLRAVVEHCNTIEPDTVPSSPCLFTVSRKGVTELAYTVRGAKKNTLVHVPIVGPLANGSTRLKCASPEIECTLRAGYIMLGNNTQVLSVVLKSFQSGSAIMRGCAIWVVPPEVGFLYQLP